MMTPQHHTALLAAELAHETKNLLMVIQTAATVLREEQPNNSDAADLLDDLLEAARRAEVVSRRLMAAAREELEAAAHTDLGATISAELTRLHRLAPARVTISADIEPIPLRTRLSAREIQQIVHELARNAFDAMPDGGTLSIHVRRVPFVGRPAFVELRVADTGVGMDSDTRTRATDAFFTTKQTGTGIGLHTIKMAVERAHGRMSIDTALTKGTRVGIYVPIIEDE